MKLPLYFTAVAFSLFSTLLQTSAFTFTFGDASECEDLPISWAGGTPPFQVLVIPVFGTPMNISIPSSAFSDGRGSFSFPLQFNSSKKIMLTMSDATGFNTGGTTNLISIRPTEGASCNSTEPNVPFSFELNNALQQCRPYTIENYNFAQQPVTIGGVVPGGDIFILRPPVGPTSFTWEAASAARGTSMVFFMFDALGRTGGSSDLVTVGSSDDSSCLNGSSPSSTSNPPSSTGTSTGSTPANTQSSPPQSSSSDPASKNNVSIAAIAGTVIGSLLFLAVIITLGLFFLRKRRDSAAAAKRISQRMNIGFDPAPDFGPPAPPIGLYPGSAHTTYPYASTPSSPYPSNPFLDSHGASSQNPSIHQLPSTNATENGALNRYSSTTAQLSVGPHSGYLPYTQTYPPNFNYPPEMLSPPDPYIRATPSDAEFDPLTLLPEQEPLRNRTTMSSSQLKASSSSQAPYRPTRFVLHTDVEDAIPGPDEDGVVELPPQYSERRAPPKDNPPLTGKSTADRRPPDVP
ncbi:hypothetical protein D9613_001740 [Agrocybe pediades]|uniref:Uncharacterized protein n=1 Tax=Agrocybe pediades TaxID=84607 RepID=A0A8H4R3V3_9AGAR|nr:hypothetical protein D9613_001740 [Agrocybe pediades]